MDKNCQLWGWQFLRKSGEFFSLVFATNPACEHQFLITGAGNGEKLSFILHLCGW